MNDLRVTRRRTALLDLIGLRGSLATTISTIRTLPWDADGDLATLTREHAVRALTQYLQGALTTTDLELWANTIESREDIGFEAHHEESLRKFVFEVANPALTNRPSHAWAQHWIDTFQLGPDRSA